MIRDYNYEKQLGLGFTESKLSQTLSFLPNDNKTLRPRLQEAYNNIFLRENKIQEHAIVFFYREELEELLTFVEDKDKLLELTIKKYLAKK